MWERAGGEGVEVGNKEGGEERVSGQHVHIQ